MQYPMPCMSVLALLSTVTLSAQDLAQGDPPLSAATPNHDPSNNEGDSGWVGAWMRVAAKARPSQPHFDAPLVTTHVMLVQQFRDDMSWQRDSSGEPGLEGVGPQTPGI